MSATNLKACLYADDLVTDSQLSFLGAEWSLVENSMAFHRVKMIFIIYMCIAHIYTHICIHTYVYITVLLVMLDPFNKK